jgi:hypothetical protein
MVIYATFLWKQFKPRSQKHCYLLHAGLLLVLLFNPEGGGNMFVRNVR